MSQDQISLPNTKTGAHVGILGGSFDPPHICHALLALSFLSLEMIDALWIVPCGNHAFKGIVEDFKHRLAMCKVAFQEINSTSVLDIEDKLQAPSYTIKTIEFIRKTRPDLNLYLGLGSDLIANFDKWHRAGEIKDQTQPVIFERSSYPVSDLPRSLNTALIHNEFALPNAKSTDLRELLENDQRAKARGYLDHRVFTYIVSHDLYRKP